MKGSFSKCFVSPWWKVSVEPRSRAKALECRTQPRFRSVESMKGKGQECLIARRFKIQKG